jgi:hypothetical protein
MGNFALGRIALASLLGCGVALVGASTPLHAQMKQAALQDNLLSTVDRLEMAANGHDLEAVMGFYSEAFTHSDDLTRQMLRDRLAELWEQYSGISYKIEVQDWQEMNGQIVAETLTQVSGSRYEGSRPIRLQAQIQSRQYFDSQTQQILRQDVLAERTIIFAGLQPPQIAVNAPEQVQVGSTFDFDVIVQEPLEGDLLLGGAIEEAAAFSDLSANPEFELELIQAGGVFKRVIAPEQPEDQWLSAIVIRQGGITLVTQRVRVVE